MVDLTKKQLAILLSKLELFENPEIKQEQYSTDPDIAADVLWNAFMLGEVRGKTIADLGCGTGILGLGALILGAERVLFVDSDLRALKTAKNSYLRLKNEFLLEKAEFYEKNVSDFNAKVDVVIQNPPFGTKKEHADREFLDTALRTAQVVYSFHKESTESFVRAFTDDKNAEITHHWTYRFPLKQTQSFHKKRIHRIDVGVWRIEKKTLKH